MNTTQALLRIQQIDLELSRIEARAKDMPQRTKLAAIETARKKLASQTTALLGKRKDLEMDYADHIADRERMEGIQADVRAKIASGEEGYRSQNALETQLTALAKRIEKLSYEEAQIESELEKYEAAEAKASQLKAELDAQVAELNASLTNDVAQMRASVKELMAERPKVAEALGDQLTARYERARKRFGTVAVETLNGNVPTGCRVALRPSDYADLRRSSGNIAECPYCKRLLVLDTEEGA